MRVVDSHIHIWRKEDPGLLSSTKPHYIGNYDPIRRDYLMTELLGDARTTNVGKFVYVQTNWSAGPLVETRWVQSVADANGHPDAIVGFADLTDPDVEFTLRAQMESPLFRGVRMALNWHEKEPFRAHCATPDMMTNRDFLRGMAILESLGLSFDLQVLPHQLEAAATLASEFPTITFVLDHAGLPHDRTVNGLAEWRRGMKGIASLPNVFVKLSGLGMCTHDWSPSLIKPIVQETINIFGPERTMFGSNFPVEKLWVDYATLFRIIGDCLEGLPGNAKASIFHDTATLAYRL